MGEPMTDKGIILSVNDVPEGKDVYNPAVLMLDNKLVVWGREESRATPTDATVRTFWLPQNPGTTLEPLADAYIFRGENGRTQEDPCAAIIQGQLVIGVVEVEWSPTGKTEWMGHKLKSFRMRFYAGSDWRHLEPFAEGPLGMKDIRLVDLGKDGIGVYARPKPDIGFTVIPSLNALTPEVITEAPALPIPHDEDEWIGTNAVYRTSEETNLLLLHSGRYDAQGNLDYRAEWLFHNFATGEVR